MDAIVHRRTDRQDHQLRQPGHHDASFLDASIRAVILMFVLIGLGCAGPGTSLTGEQVELREEACSTQPHKAEYGGQASKSCRPQRTWLQDVGDTLSGAAPAFSAPKP